MQSIRVDEAASHLSDMSKIDIIRLQIAEVSALLTVLQYQTVRHPVHLNKPEFCAAAQDEQWESRYWLASANECGLNDMMVEPISYKMHTIAKALQ